MRWGGRQGTPPPPCLHFLRGSCHFGDTCRFSHAPPEEMPNVLPFQHRRLLTVPQANTGCSSSSVASPSAWRLRIMSYNILADQLAHEHAAELYNSVPRHALEWGFRSRLLVREVAHYMPDVVCLQEVDHFQHLQAALGQLGYEGLYTKRTGDRHDGLATFWRTDVLRPVKQKEIKFNRLSMKDNVAQLLVLQRLGSSSYTGQGEHAEQAASASSSGSERSSGQKRGRQQDQRSEQQAGAGQQQSGGRQHIRFSDSSSSDESSGEQEQAEPARAQSSQQQQQDEGEEMVIEDAIPGGQQQGSLQPAATTAAAAGAPEGGAGSSGRRSKRHLRRGQHQQVVLANIHVLFSPKRGDIKLGQVRTLLEEVHRLGRRYGAPAAICGDFNSAAGSPIYQFVREGRLDLHSHDRRYLSGQTESRGSSWHALRHDFLWRQEQAQAAAQAAAAGVAANGAYSALAVSAREVTASYTTQGMVTASALEAMMVQQLAVVPPFAPPPEVAVAAAAGSPTMLENATDASIRKSSSSFGGSGSRSRNQRAWTAEDLRLALGDGSGGSKGSSPGGSRSKGKSGASAGSSSATEAVATHPLQVCSAYSAATGSEPAYTTCHDKRVYGFIGTVDYIWFTPGRSSANCLTSSSHHPAGSGGHATSRGISSGSGSAWEMRPLAVLLPPAVQSLRSGLPNHQWPSDHISLLADFELSPTGQL